MYRQKLFVPNFGVAKAQGGKGTLQGEGQSLI